MVRSRQLKVLGTTFGAIRTPQYQISYLAYLIQRGSTDEDDVATLVALL
jgi:hypothetical protein